jgi:predicted dehydrogenase
MVDLLGYLLGDYAKVSAFYFERRPGEGPEPINMPYVYSANYRFESGVLANATTSRVLTEVKASRRELLIVCDDSLIEWSAQAVVENGETLWQAGESNNAFVTQAAAFVEAVRAGDLQRMRSPYPASLNSLAAVLGANASAENGGQVVDLASFVAGE